MNPDALLDHWRDALTLAATVAAPFLIVTLAIGLLVALLQTATQLNENLLTFAPKLAGALVVVALGGHWVVDRLARFTAASFEAAAGDLTPAPEPMAGPSAAPGVPSALGAPGGGVGP